jgi:hypothetical protein
MIADLLAEAQGDYQEQNGTKKAATHSGLHSD